MKCSNPILILYYTFILAGKFYIKSYESGEYMSAVKEDVFVIKMNKDKKSAEVFMLEDVKEGNIFNAVNRANNCLDIFQSVTKLILFSKHGGDNQIFKILDTNIRSTVHLIQNKNECLKVYSDKGVLKVRCDKNDQKQQFEFEYLVNDDIYTDGIKAIDTIREAVDNAVFDICELESIEKGDLPDCKGHSTSSFDFSDKNDC